MERLHMEENSFDPFKTGQIDMQYSQARDLLEEGLEELLNYGSHLLKQKKFAELKAFIADKTRGLNRERDLKELRPYSLVDLESDIQTNKEGLKTGWPALDKLIRIPQEALTIIAGQPSHGKTSVLLNMFINSINLYPDRQFLYYSYEENSKHLALKLIINMSEHCEDELNNFSYFEKIIKQKDSIGQPAIKAAVQKLETMTKNRRLWLFDHGPDLDDLHKEIAFLSNQQNLGGIFIDYVQKMKLKDTTLERQRELQVISNELLRMAKAFKVPIILGAQLEKSKDPNEQHVKLDQLRDAGDIEQDANLILGVYNKSMLKARQGVQMNDRMVDLTLSILKNRNGAVNQNVVLRFDRPVLKIRDYSHVNAMNGATQRINRL
jgi:replicative DNA helicase